MDTAYNLPFQAYLIVNPNTSAQKIDFGPWGDIQLSHEPEEDCATIKENDEMDKKLKYNKIELEACYNVIKDFTEKNERMEKILKEKLFHQAV